ncbi:DUF1254 domain-containing protein [Thalassotalea psychrophila]|uniref:DUF1254 domain-containing protein n=1 Tax=Thalassotalea psychrophila TaxID=3065647 RepID=A0ABY9U026_9GAMM|nr:DUF1254 domain-containing protein [Colwelliaceae bacterium SQ149]
MMKKFLLSMLVACTIALPAVADVPVTVPAAKSYVNNLSLDQRIDHHRAIESMIWSMPLMNMIAMREGMANAGVGFNDVAYHSSVQTWTEQFTTNNNTVPYVYTFWNVSEGPVVIEIPATYKGIPLVGAFLDAWQRPTEDFGPTGFDGGYGGKYVMLPPNYDGSYPAGYIPIQQKTYNGYSLIRPVVKNFKPETMATMIELVKQIKIYPLSEAGKPAKTKYIDVAGKHIDALPKFDASYFVDLHKVLQEEKLEERDKVALGMLRELGIEKGVEFNITKAQQNALNEAAKDAHMYMINEYLDESASIAYEGTNWSNAVPDEGNTHMTTLTWNFPNYLSYNSRGAGYNFFYSAMKKLGKATYYLKSSRDKDAVRLNGSNDYVLTVPKDVPAKRFWSVTAYSNDDATWFDNQPKGGVDSASGQLKTNADGTTTIYFGAKAPKGKEGNWVPTTAGREYFLYFRFYGPTAAAYGEWKLNDLVKVH